MDSQQIEKQLEILFKEWSGDFPDSVVPLAPNGSARHYYRLSNKKTSAIGTYNPNLPENQAFVNFAAALKEAGISVPTIYAKNLGQHLYIQEDLGNLSLYKMLQEERGTFTPEIVAAYEKSVQQLAHLQIKGHEKIDYSYCYPRQAFDRQSMQWDFNTFKYYFLNLTNIAYDEEALETDAQTLFDYLLQSDTEYFLFRDFQARNIQIVNGEPYFIDFQGGRKGALQYDLASLLYQSSAKVPDAIRSHLLDVYIKEAASLIDIDIHNFKKLFDGYVLMRCIQVFGTYGRRGLHERKAYFLNSIPQAIQNIQSVFPKVNRHFPLPELTAVIEMIANLSQFKTIEQPQKKPRLTVQINSFSYKRGIPKDESGHGEGFVFDCRFLNNPGRYEPYKKLTGRDEPVINFLHQHSNIRLFLQDVYDIVDRAVENYIDRDFECLTVNFGCTGGQHRSVYSADALQKHLSNKYGIQTKIHHVEQERKGWKN